PDDDRRSDRDIVADRQPAVRSEVAIAVDRHVVAERQVPPAVDEDGGLDFEIPVLPPKQMIEDSGPQRDPAPALATQDEQVQLVEKPVRDADLTVLISHYRMSDSVPPEGDTAP